MVSEVQEGDARSLLQVDAKGLVWFALVRDVGRTVHARASSS